MPQHSDDFVAIVDYFLFRFCLGDGLAQLVLCDEGKKCVDISSFGMGGMPEELTPLSWKIAGADILCLVACSIGEQL